MQHEAEANDDPMLLVFLFRIEMLGSASILGMSVSIAQTTLLRIIEEDISVVWCGNLARSFKLSTPHSVWKSSTLF